jgi:biotin-(acetyl-CoA carboxylase) ligase
MRILDPNLPLTDPRTARMAAETIVCCGFNATRAARELRPDLKAHRAFAHRLMREPLVLKEIERIMEKPERNAQKFTELMWNWLEVEGTEQEIGNGQKVRLLSKSDVEMKQTAARILARGYISEKKPLGPPERPMVNFDLGNEISNLTEVPVATKVTQ